MCTSVNIFIKASHYTYRNSLTRITMNGNLSRNIEENLGVKQGRNKSSDHYKLYIAPLLDILGNSKLGVWIGHINVGVSGVADDVYLMSDSRQSYKHRWTLHHIMERCIGSHMEQQRPK